MSSQPSPYALRDTLTIIPGAHIRIFDLEYQAVLYRAFHMTRIASVGHRFCTPFVILGFFGLLGLLPAVASPAEAFLAPVGGLWPMLLAGVMLLVFAALEVVVAVLLAPFLALLMFGAEQIAMASGDQAVWVLLAIAVAAGVLQTASHSAEPVPPPLSRSVNFEALGDYLRRQGAWGVLSVIVTFPAYVTLELWASTRVLHLQALETFMALGYRPRLNARIGELSQEMLRARPQDAAKAPWTVTSRVPEDLAATRPLPDEQRRVIDLPRAWRLFFGAEVLIWAAICVHWIVAPEHYLTAFLGAELAPQLNSGAAWWLTQVGTILAFCGWVWFYARMLLSRRSGLLAFGYFQEALALANVFLIVAAATALLRLTPHPLFIATAMVVATIWLLARVAFIAGVKQQAPLEA